MVDRQKSRGRGRREVGKERQREQTCHTLTNTNRQQWKQTDRKPQECPRKAWPKQRYTTSSVGLWPKHTKTRFENSASLRQNSSPAPTMYDSRASVVERRCPGYPDYLPFSLSRLQFSVPNKTSRRRWGGNEKITSKNRRRTTWLPGVPRTKTGLSRLRRQDGFVCLSGSVRVDVLQSISQSGEFYFVWRKIKPV